MTNLGDPNEKPNSKRVGLVWRKESLPELTDWFPPSPVQGSAQSPAGFTRHADGFSTDNTRVIQDVGVAIEHTFTPKRAAAAKRAAQGGIAQSVAPLPTPGQLSPLPHQQRTSWRTPPPKDRPWSQHHAAAYEHADTSHDAVTAVEEGAITRVLLPVVLFMAGTCAWTAVVIQVLRWQRFPFFRHQLLVAAMCAVPPLLCVLLVAVVDAWTAKPRKHKAL
eukprot:TRINITY_DN1795_c0_g1_i1.p1 TRINITY_DN1795_c0_g1~~TRINITY_DN1795_c0_g1_i1.p1  ORF type:complete len:220 (-),score=27.37 TRINITY_DN1795_c0_g1_i1:277-936(-)